MGGLHVYKGGPSRTRHVRERQCLGQQAASARGDTHIETHIHQVNIPSYFPPADHAVLRFEWYALHRREGFTESRTPRETELYATCADVKLTGGQPLGEGS